MTFVISSKKQKAKVTAKIKAKSKTASLQLVAGNLFLLEDENLITAVKVYKEAKEADKLHKSTVLNQLDAAKKILMYHIETLELPAEDKGVLQTPDGEIINISAVSQSRSITDLGKAIEYLGEELFLKVAKITLKDLDKYLTEDELGDVIETTRSGKHNIS